MCLYLRSLSQLKSNLKPLKTTKCDRSETSGTVRLHVSSDKMKGWLKK